MKILIILSLVLGVGAVGVGLYSKLETHDRYKHPGSKAEAETIRKIPAERRSRVQSLTLKIRDNITSALKIQQAAMWILGLLAIGLSGFVLVRRYPSKLPFGGLGLGALGLLLALLTLP